MRALHVIPSAPYVIPAKAGIQRGREGKPVPFAKRSHSLPLFEGEYEGVPAKRDARA